MNWPEVRISEHKDHLLCFARECGTRLAQRIEFNQPNVPKGTMIVFGAGWLEEAGPDGMSVWRMSTHARDRFRQGKTPRFRRRPPESSPDTPWVLDHRSLGIGRDRPTNWGRVATDLPALVVCPRCDRTQFAPATLLQVSERRASIRRKLGT